MKFKQLIVEGKTLDSFIKDISCCFSLETETGKSSKEKYKFSSKV